MADPAPPMSGKVAMDEERVTCSAKGCQRSATVLLAWNNPKIHTPGRRKTWAACPEHHAYLRDFLKLRGFLRAEEPVDDAAGDGSSAHDPG